MTPSSSSPNITLPLVAPRSIAKFFFFSSRRRHTRWNCAWSSDVCSSDLHREEALGSRLAILDVNLGPGCPSGLDAHSWLAAEHFSGRIVFLTGHAQSYPLVERAGALADGARI